MSCLFNSLAPEVYVYPETLRGAITKYLMTNPTLMDDVKASDIIKWTSGSSLMDYVESMSRPGVWGGAIEIRAFCELYTMNVKIHVLYTGKKFTINCSGQPTRTIHISYTGSHFEPLYTEIH